MKTFRATSAMRPEWVRQTPQQFAEVIEALLNSSAASEVDAAAIAAQLEDSEAGGADESVERFAQVSALCQWHVERLASNSAEATAVAEVYHWMAGFEAALIVRRNSEHFLVSDEGSYSAGYSTVRCVSYKDSLKALTAIGGYHCWHAAFTDIVSAYYRMMDRKMAEVYWRSTHRSIDLVRVGPYSVANGERVRCLDRPGITLEGVPLQSFARDVGAVLAVDATDERLHEICAVPRVERIRGYVR